MNVFYLICPIGLEDLMLEEIQLKWPMHFPKAPLPEVINETKGGIEIKTELNYGLALNKILKTPTRILLRLKKQKCRDLPKLYKILKKVNWKEYLKQENITFKVSASKSRLFHSDKIEKTAKDALKDYFMANQISQKLKLTDKTDQIIYLRISADELEISLDTSGERLDKRIQDNYRGKASIRENYGATLCLALLGSHQYPTHTFIDPMCGSGTQIKEAFHFFEVNQREFAFNNWNIDFNLDITSKPNSWNIKKWVGNELDENVFKKLEHDNIEFINKDFFKIKMENPTLLILNPPYGKRIKIEGDRRKYFLSIIDKVKKDLNPTKFGIIIPQDVANNIQANKRIAFNQNGIKVQFLVFQNF